ncbi:MAG: phosphonate ABC transporter, permease protein PhnE [Clostridia bacterium]|nr:phosphonate ABC transporter, permease protein PhnE [Clostridia bacterium]
MKKAASSGYREPLFDRLFKPQVITLPNGHTVSRPRSRMPLIAGILILVIWLSIQLTGFDLSIIARRGNQFLVILRRIFSPDMFAIKSGTFEQYGLDPEKVNFLSVFSGGWWASLGYTISHSFAPKVVGPMLDTIRMSVLGSFIGATLALPLAVFCSTNINKNRVSIWIFRFLLNIIRTLPTLVIAKIFALIFGLGTYAGTMAILVFTFGVISKMMYESIETIDMGAFEAMESCGANKFQAFWSACMKQILPTYLSYCLYALEMNIRAASILGYVGAGGLGILIDERIGWRDYESLGTLLLMLFVLVVTIESISGYLRRKLS